MKKICCILICVFLICASALGEERIPSEKPQPIAADAQAKYTTLFRDMVDAYMLMKSDSSALEVAQENYRLANLNYEAGNATLSEVLQAHALLLQAENAITDRRTTYVVARRRLLDLREH